jgi:transcriptional regulator with XRE-family HTH domain
MEAVDTPQDTPQQRLEKAQRYHQRFDDALQARMKEIGLPKFQEVADVAGITVTTVGALRKGENYPSLRTAWGIDTAMRWQKNPSSTLALFNGGDAVPLPDKVETPEEDPYETRIRALPNLSAEKKEQIIAKMRSDRQAELERAEALDKLAQAEGPKTPNGNKGRRSA